MRTLPMAALLGLLALGCRSDNSTVLLERDLRLQEDKIWHLQSCLEDAQMAREATIRENESLRRELADASRAPATSMPAGEDFEPPSVDLPESDLPSRREIQDLEPPTIELPESGEAPPADAAPANDQAVVNSPPAQLVINKRLTGGFDRDGRHGDEGLLVVFELRDSAGRLAQWPGKVSVVAVDPALEGPEARVARWDISSAEVPAHYLNTLIGRGFQFELPWPSRPPANRDLVVFVRFTTQEGEKLTSDTKINVRPPEGDAPGFDRQTRRDAPNHGAAAGEPAPRSRLKARAPSSTDSARSTSGAEQVDRPTTPEETPLEAARPQRPEWKPFR